MLKYFCFSLIAAYPGRIFDEFMVEVVDSNALVVVDDTTLAVDALPAIVPRDALGKIEHNILLKL